MSEAPLEPDSWDRDGKHVLAELQRIAQAIEQLNTNTQTHLEQAAARQRQVDEHEKELAALKTRESQYREHMQDRMTKLETRFTMTVGFAVFLASLLGNEVGEWVRRIVTIGG